MAQLLQVVIDGVHYEVPAVDDTDGDGHPDTATIEYGGDTYRVTDLDYDGVPDVIRVVRADQSRCLLWRASDANTFTVISDTGAHDDSLAEGASHWFGQATPYTCGPAAITMVLADLFDVRISDEHQVWQRAIDLDAITAKGMRARDIEQVIESYGIPARTVTTNARQLESLLEQGHEVIMMVDADEYWPGFDGRGVNDVHQQRPHAVRVLGIDHEADVAILSDSGKDDPLFAQLAVPLEHLNDAWHDLDWLAVVTEVTHHHVREQLEKLGAQLDGALVQRDERSRLSTVFLPITVRLSRLLRALSTGGSR